MRIVLAAALITIAGGAIADDRTNLAKRYESAETINALVEAGRPFFSDLSRACGKVAHLLTELRNGWGQDPVRSEAYSSISSCCVVVGTEPPRLHRRPFGLSHAAICCSPSMA